MGADLPCGEQEPVVAVGTLNHMVVTAPSGPPDGVTESRLLAGRIQGVRTDAESERRQVGKAAHSEVHAATIAGQS